MDVRHQDTFGGAGTGATVFGTTGTDESLDSFSNNAGTAFTSGWLSGRTVPFWMNTSAPPSVPYQPESVACCMKNSNSAPLRAVRNELVRVFGADLTPKPGHLNIGVFRVVDDVVEPDQSTVTH